MSALNSVEISQLKRAAREVVSNPTQNDLSGEAKATLQRFLNHNAGEARLDGSQKPLRFAELGAIIQVDHSALGKWIKHKKKGSPATVKKVLTWFLEQTENV